MDTADALHAADEQEAEDAWAGLGTLETHRVFALWEELGAWPHGVALAHLTFVNKGSLRGLPFTTAQMEAAAEFLADRGLAEFVFQKGAYLLALTAEGRA